MVVEEASVVGGDGWLPVLAGALTCGPRPGKKRWPLLARAGCDAVVTLLAETEGALETRAAVERLGWEWHWIAMSSAKPPDDEACASIRAGLCVVLDSLSAGRRVYLHCSAGLHRTGMIACALLLLSGRSEDESRAGLRAMRAATAEALTPGRWEAAVRIAGGSLTEQ